MGLILIADLNAEQLEQLSNIGFAPAITVETRPDNFEAWIKLSSDGVADATHQAALDGLHRRLKLPYNCDKNEFGSLGGFTNRLAPPNATGAYRYILARNTSGEIAANAPALLAAIEKAMRMPSYQKATGLAREPGYWKRDPDRGHSRWDG